VWKEVNICHWCNLQLIGVTFDLYWIWDSHSCGYEEFDLPNITYGPLKVNRRFEGTCCLHIHGRRISQARILLYFLPALHCFHAWLILRRGKWGRQVSPKRRFTLDGLHGDMSQKMEFDLRFSRLSLWRVLSFDIQDRVAEWNSNDVSEEHIASIFRVKY
jgi:hypothetical protein